MEKYLENAKTILFEYGPNVLYALGLLIIGLFLIKKLVKFTKKIMSSGKVDITLQNFLINIVSVNFAVRPWCKVEHYWDVYFGITENCKLALDKAGIEIPYPHSVEIHKRA